LKLLGQGFHCTAKKTKGNPKIKLAIHFTEETHTQRERERERERCTLPYLPVGSTSTNSE
jgi:hypothetical protein